MYPDRVTVVTGLGPSRRKDTNNVAPFRRFVSFDTLEQVVIHRALSVGSLYRFVVTRGLVVKFTSPRCSSHLSPPYNPPSSDGQIHVYGRATQVTLGNHLRSTLPLPTGTGTGYRRSPRTVGRVLVSSQPYPS